MNILINVLKWLTIIPKIIDLINYWRELNEKKKVQ
jgi:hypothetical protein